MIRNSKGMTFVELMVVIAIVGTMAAMAIPLMSGSRTKLKTAARDVVSNLQVARLNAMRDGQWARWRITFDTSANSYSVSNLVISAAGVPNWGTDGNPDTADDVYNTPTKTVKLNSYGKNIIFGSGYSFSPQDDTALDDGITFVSNQLTFRPNGSVVDTATGAPAGRSIYITDQKTKDTIVITVGLATGRIHMRTNFGRGWSK